MLSDRLSTLLKWLEVSKDTYDKALILVLNDVLEVTLTPDQVNYILQGTPMPPERQNGKTFAYCIRLALSGGEPIDFKKLGDFADYPGTSHYARDYFIRTFYGLYLNLEKSQFFKLRSLVNQPKKC